MATRDEIAGMLQRTENPPGLRSAYWTGPGNNDYVLGADLGDDGDGQVMPLLWMDREKRGPFRVRGGRGPVMIGGARYRMTMEIESDGLYCKPAERPLLSSVADSAAKEIQRDMETVTAKVAPATRGFRARAAKAWARKADWAVARFDGGTTGPTPPTGSGEDRWLHHSGRLALTVRASVTGTDPVRSTVNVANNRLNPNTFAGTDFERFLERLRFLVPSLRWDVLSQRESMQGAIAESMDAMMANKAREVAEKERRLVAESVRTVMRLV